MGTYPGYRENKARLEADVDKIVDRLQNTDITATQLRAEYRCGHPLMLRVILSKISKRKWAAIRKRKLTQGTAKSPTRFQPGIVPWNKGRKIKPHPNSVKTQFKKGELRGAAARKWRPIGAITIRHDKAPKRRRHRKRSGGGKFQGKPRRWIKIKDEGRIQDMHIPLARHLWQKQYGPVPDGKFVIHLDGDTLNDDISNLCIVDHATSIKLTRHRDPEMEKVRLKRMRTKTPAKMKTHIAKQKNKERGELVAWWECSACGFEYHKKDPHQS